MVRWGPGATSIGLFRAGVNGKPERRGQITSRDSKTDLAFNDAFTTFSAACTTTWSVTNTIEPFFLAIWGKKPIAILIHGEVHHSGCEKRGDGNGEMPPFPGWLRKKKNDPNKFQWKLIKKIKKIGVFGGGTTPGSQLVLRRKSTGGSRAPTNLACNWAVFRPFWGSKNQFF